MNKTAIKNFAVWARNKLIADISYKAGLMGISEDGIKSALPQSTKDTKFYDIGTKEPYAVCGEAVRQRGRLADLINQKAGSSDYKTAYRSVIEEVAYTWFNRLIAIRFMEVNDYLPSHIRALSSESGTKLEPDLVTTPFDAELDLSDYEQAEIIRMKNENLVDDLFRLLFVKQCNALNAVLPKLFEKTADYTELLLNVSVTDQDGVVYHLVHDIPENDFKEAVEIIGWMYQYYNDQRKNEVINIYKGTVKKEDIPAATQLFTTDWVVRYMVDNSLGRYWIERNPDSGLKDKLRYFVTPKDGAIQTINEKVDPKDLTFFDPCMGSGHILVYAFDVLMEIYRECGYSDRDAVDSIIQHNLFGLDIDNRAYQIAYFAIMMRARNYSRRALTKGLHPNIYPLYESYECSIENKDLQYLMDEFRGVQQYGSLINIKRHINLDRLQQEVDNIEGQLTLGMVDIAMATNIIKVTRILLNRYCVVCTNPPYLNKMNPQLKEYILTNYKNYSGDLFSVFMFKNFDYCKKDGYSAFMTPFVWMFIKTYEQLREFIINQKSITTLVQMEYSAFEEATVPICSFVLKNGKSDGKGLYFKLSNFKGGMDVQKERVLAAISDKDCGYFYETAEENFSKIPGSPIAYWASGNIFDCFSKNKKLSDYVTTRLGMATANNDQFMRFWMEISTRKFGVGMSSRSQAVESGKKWFPYNKGGDFRRWYGNNYFVVNWENDGVDIQSYKDEKTGRIRSHNYNLDYIFNPGLTWSALSSAYFSVRAFDKGFLFDDKGSSAFMDLNIRPYVIGLLNSIVSEYIIKLINPTISFQPGNLSNLPFVQNNQYFDEICNTVANCCSISKEEWDSYETSWDFITHPLITYRSGTISAAMPMDQWQYRIGEAFDTWKSNAEMQFNQLKSNEEKLNRIFIDIYGLQDELPPEVNDKDVTVRKADLGRDIRSLISYAVGCMFGRYSLDVPGLAYAGGEWDDSKYSSFIPDKDNILPITDEEYFEDDIVGLFCAWLKKVYGADTLEENLDFIAKALGNKGNTSREVIRSYFLKDFFADHCKIYQKRPIYWLFDSGKQNGFKALIYMHRYDENTIGNLRIDYLHRMERVYDSEIARMQDIIDNSRDGREVTKATKRKEKLQKQIKECKEYDEKIAHLALARIPIDLDDGVKVNYEKVQTVDGVKYPVLAKI